MAIANAAEQFGRSRGTAALLAGSDIMVAMERDQLLSMNHKMAALLVRQCQEACCTAMVLAGEQQQQQVSSDGPLVVALRRCLSLEVSHATHQYTNISSVMRMSVGWGLAVGIWAHKPFSNCDSEQKFYCMCSEGGFGAEGTVLCVPSQLAH